jgi:hypothetical protein
MLGYAPYSLTATNIVRTGNQLSILCRGCNSEPTGSRLQLATQTRIKQKPPYVLTSAGVSILDVVVMVLLSLAGSGAKREAGAPMSGIPALPPQL